MIDHEKEWRLKAASAMEEIAMRLREDNQGCLVSGITFVHFTNDCKNRTSAKAIVTGIDHDLCDFTVSVAMDEEDGDTKQGEIG